MRISCYNGGGFLDPKTTFQMLLMVGYKRKWTILCLSLMGMIFFATVFGHFKKIFQTLIYFSMYFLFSWSLSLFLQTWLLLWSNPPTGFFGGLTPHEFLKSLSFPIEFILQRNKNEEIPNEATGFGIIISRLCIGTNSTIVSQQKWLKKCNLKSWFQIYTPSFPHIVIQQQQTLLPEIVERRHTTTCSIDKWPPKLYV